MGSGDIQHDRKPAGDLGDVGLLDKYGERRPRCHRYNIGQFAIADFGLAGRARPGALPLSDMQSQAGHANAATTLLYARPADAKTRRARIAF